MRRFLVELVLYASTWLRNKALERRYDPRDECPRCGQICAWWNIEQIADEPACEEWYAWVSDECGYVDLDYPVAVDREPRYSIGTDNACLECASEDCTARYTKIWK